jgi:nitroimidazol reductase NimA-like FMN-containing flavoprotein (pyridoxamine 5'-phosphate oxidase superfamily)
MSGLTEFGRLRTAGLMAQLPRAEMERQIAGFLRQGNVCVLATCRDDVPRATPIEYYSDGLTIYVAASRGTKVPNLENNPRVGVAICSRPYTDWTDWYDVSAVQITGEPELLRFDERPDDYREALRVYDWRKYRRALGMADEEPRNTTFVKINPRRIEFRDLALLRMGFAVLQVWEAGES